MTKQKGRCLCGNISFTTELKDENFSACHCNMCRRWGSGPYLALQAKLDDLKGEEHIKSYKSSEWAERAFCQNCGTNLYYKVTAEGPHLGNTYISLGLLDETAGMSLTEEIFIDEKPEGFEFAGNHPKLTGAEVMAEFTGEGSD
jgi:hypothetical protein